MKKALSLAVFSLFSLALFFSLGSATTDCWSSSYNTESTCSAQSDCNWHESSSGDAWCEQRQCWDFWNQSACDSADISGKNCTWNIPSVASSGWCETTQCWSFDGTNSSTCESNSEGLDCVWETQCFSEGAASADCWSISSQNTCESTEGCFWGLCEADDCWQKDNQTSCEAATGWSGGDCAWQAADWTGAAADEGWCYEQGCWDYTNSTACNSGADALNCTWNSQSNYCSQASCWNYDFTNETACESNAYNLSCTWDGNWCNEGASCWNNENSSACGSASGCTWNEWTSSGWCEEVGCWQWDTWNSGNESACTTNGAIYGLNCTWENDTWTATEGDGWCYQSYSWSCADAVDEPSCVGTNYCFWNYTDVTDPAAGGNCLEPGAVSGVDQIFNEWNPGCYIFDSNAADCGNTTGCTWNTTTSLCASNTTIDTEGLKCAYLNDSQLCGNIPALSTCCEWQAGSCVENRLSTRCWDELEDAPSGIVSCGDVSMATTTEADAQSLCTDIAGSPWYMPCEWNNATNTCTIKAGDIYDDPNAQSLIFIDNSPNCEAAGGKWVSESYCSGPGDTISVSAGRCEPKADEERNCNIACYACEYKFDGSNHSNIKDATDFCYGSDLGYCKFTEDSTAPNGFGRCTPNEQAQSGLVTDCNTDCGSCSFTGNPAALQAFTGNSETYDTCNTPDCFCRQSDANCKWVDDSTNTQGGYCLDQSEKTCAESCDLCYEEEDCTTLGRTSYGDAGACEWSDSTSTCSKRGDSVEICWDGIDNDNDTLIDCADTYCLSECGFVDDSLNCFGYSDNTSCIAGNCSWITDSAWSWCDFPGANCWQYDGNETQCNTNNATCEWYAGYGTGWCDTDWSKNEQCVVLTSEASCGSNSNCSWTNDTWCDSSGSQGDAWCDTTGGWCDHVDLAPKNCWEADTNSTACNAISGCGWNSWNENATFTCKVDWSGDCWDNFDEASCGSGCFWQNYTEGNGGWCSNLADQCWTYDSSSNCEANNNCRWANYGGSNDYCEPKCWDPELNQTSCTSGNDICVWGEEGWCGDVGNNCWQYGDNQTSCSSDGNCSWQEPGWCDPLGFSGGGAAAGSGAGAQTGLDCWQSDGNQTACTAATGCSWTSNDWPTCEPDWSAECWQYDANQTYCEANSCWWNTDYNYCSNTAEQCWSNTSLSSDETACNANSNCNWTSFGGNGWCESSCFDAADQGACGAGCQWIDGWCNPSSMTEAFDTMEAGQPVMLGTDTCPESGIAGEADICGFGMKDMGDSYGFGMHVESLMNASFCNNEQIMDLASSFWGVSTTGTGQNTVRYWIYLDTDGSTSGGCALSHNSSASGYEFRLGYASEWDSSAQRATETVSGFRCLNSAWTAADIDVDAWKKIMCSDIGGPMIAVDKNSLDKFPVLYDSTADIRVYVASADSTGSVNSVTDEAGPGWVTPGAVDFEIQDFFEGAGGAEYEKLMEQGYVSYETTLECADGIDNDEDGLVDCADYDCEFATACSSYDYSSDTTTPSIIGVKIEYYPDSALIMYDTNKPANGRLTFYKNDSTCTTPNATIYDIGMNLSSVRDNKSWHYAAIYNDGGIYSLDYDLENNTAYYYKLSICDSRGKCGISQCSNFTTAASSSACGYCDFVTLLNVPTEWTVSYDLDTDGTYEHTQGQMCGPNAGMKTNYTSGRSANIKLANSDGSVYFEFLNSTLTKTGLTSTTRTINQASDLIYDTEEGYVGMPATTRDKIINNLHPEVCRVKIPFEGTCNALYHCDDSGNNCVDKTSESTLVDSTNCIWQLPYCEFSTWDENGNPSPSSSPGSPGSPGGVGPVGSSSSTDNDDNTSDIDTSDSELSDGSEITGDTIAGNALGRDADESGINLNSKTLTYLLIGAVIIVAAILFLRKGGSDRIRHTTRAARDFHKARRMRAKPIDRNSLEKYGFRLKPK